MAEEQKSSGKRPLHAFFASIPPHYDLVNRIFTWGLDERWRRKTARICLERKPQKVMDLCCGTGDLAIWMARLAEPATQVFGLDYSRPMLELAKQKAQRYFLKAGISFIHGDAADLPFPGGFFDCIGIAFAFRNLTYKNPLTRRYFAEIARVLKPGGEFVIVESSQPPNRFIRMISHAYVRWVVFWAGCWISGNRPAYKYLSESARRFYTAEELDNLLVAAGFKKVMVKRLFFGAAAIHRAVK
ncbi:MAG: bifunctional demethylmenaquinone methyltransferase/2-methoxy-6-polyprenyl-1,4-benzoquinol methylase UbiE [bacterium]